MDARNARAARAFEHAEADTGVVATAGGVRRGVVRTARVASVLENTSVGTDAGGATIELENATEGSFADGNPSPTGLIAEGPFADGTRCTGVVNVANVCDLWQTDARNANAAREIEDTGTVANVDGLSVRPICGVAYWGALE